MATLFVDLENGNDNFGGTSFNVLASGTDGAIASPPQTAYSIFTSPSANFPNDGSIVGTKNLAWYTEAFFNNVNLNNTTINIENVAAPSGISSRVYSLLENSLSSTHTMWTGSGSNWYTAIYNATQYTLSIYAKANGRNKLILRWGSDAKSARYNLSNGTVEETGASASSSISSIGNGWYRISLTITTSGSAGSYSADAWEVYLLQDSFVSLTASSSTYLGDDISGVYLCAMQIEAASSVTAYEQPPLQLLSIFNGTSYIFFYITERISSTSLRLNIISGGTALSVQNSRQYYIGGRFKNINFNSTNAGVNANNLIPGDTIRIMGSPAPTLVGSGTWTSARGSSAVSITGSTNTSPITITTSSSMSTLGLSTGDTITIIGHTTNTNANGTWEITVANPALGQCTLNGSTGNGVGASTGVLRKRTNTVVRLASPVTANIASFGNRGEGRTAWTGVTNVTVGFDTTDSKEGDVSDSIAITAAFTTGKAAFKATGTLDLSGYQQISFWIRQTAGTVAVNGDISLRLCSDTTGDTPVHTFNIEGLGVVNNWACLVINLGSNMSSNIQSVALYVNVDRGAQTFLLSNIIACKASSSVDSLNLTSLVGKNTTDEAWFPIMSINGTRVVLGSYNALTPLVTFGAASTGDSYRGYYGVSGTFDVYKRETIKTAIGISVNSPSIMVVPESGTKGNPISYEFGWDRTNMSVQNLETYVDAKNSQGIALSSGNNSYINVRKLGLVRYAQGAIFSANSSFLNLSLEWGIACSNTAWIFNRLEQSVIEYIYASSNQWNIGTQSSNTTITKNTFNKIISVCASAGQGFGMNEGIANNTFSNLILNNNSRCGLEIRQGSDNIFTDIVCNDNGPSTTATTAAINFITSHRNKIVNLSTSNNTGGGILLTTGELWLVNANIGESTEFVNGSSANGRICSSNHDNTVNNNVISTDFGLIRSQASVRYSNSGLAWSLSPTNSTYRTANYPLDLAIATIAVNANGLVTVRAWMRRSNTLLATGLRIKGGQIAGVTNDITSYMTAAADTWQQVTLTFTPSEVGVVEILAECYGGTTHTAYVDDISVTQV